MSFNLSSLVNKNKVSEFIPATFRGIETSFGTDALADIRQQSTIFSMTQSAKFRHSAFAW
jgi:hypothetical protein